MSNQAALKTNLRRGFQFLLVFGSLFIVVLFFVAWPDVSELYRPLRLGFIDKTGKTKIPPTFYDALSFSEGLAAVQAKSGSSILWGFIDSEGQMVIRPKYAEVLPFSEGLAAVREIPVWGDKPTEDPLSVYTAERNTFTIGRPTQRADWCFIDKTGKRVAAGQYICAGSFHEGLAPVRIGFKWGYINKRNEVEIPASFDNAFPFSEGLAAVGIHDPTSPGGYTYGYINKAGRMVLPPKYSFAGFFHGGAAIVSVEYKRTAIDREGKQLIEPGGWHTQLSHSGLFETVYHTNIPARFSPEFDKKRKKFVVHSFGNYIFYKNRMVNDVKPDRDVPIGYIDKTGSIRISCVPPPGTGYWGLIPFADGVGVLSFHNNEGGYIKQIISREGEVLGETNEVGRMRPFSEGLALRTFQIERN